MKVAAELGDGIHSCIGDEAALGKHEVPEPRSHIDNFNDGLVRQAAARRKVQDA